MIGRFKEIFLSIGKWLDNLYPFGSQISIFRYLKILWDNIISLDLDQRATSVAFSFLLAIFPAMLFLFTLIPYIPINDLEVRIMDFIQDLMPAGLYEAVAQTIYEIISRPRRDILSFGFLFSLFAATNGINSLRRAFNAALDETKGRSFVRARGVAVFVIVALILILLLAIVLLIAGRMVLNYVIDQGIAVSGFNIFGVNVLGYISVFFIFYFGIACLYYFAPDIPKKIKFFNFGAAFSSLMCILATNLFSYYLENFGSYNKLYGSIGTLIAIMVWVYLISLLLILGFELNVGLREEKLKIQNEE